MGIMGIGNGEVGDGDGDGGEIVVPRMEMGSCR